MATRGGAVVGRLRQDDRELIGLATEEEPGEGGVGENITSRC